jgi:hypothetical protein
MTNPQLLFRVVSSLFVFILDCVRSLVEVFSLHASALMKRDENNKGDKRILSALHFFLSPVVHVITGPFGPPFPQDLVAKNAALWLLKRRRRIDGS